MANKNRNFIDDMVDMFGYDYVIGFCLCSEYDVLRKADVETDEKNKYRLINIARKYKAKANELLKERMENGL